MFVVKESERERREGERERAKQREEKEQTAGRFLGKMSTTFLMLLGNWRNTLAVRALALDPLRRPKSVETSATCGCGQRRTTGWPLGPSLSIEPPMCRPHVQTGQALAVGLACLDVGVREREPKRPARCPLLAAPHPSQHRSQTFQRGRDGQALADRLAFTPTLTYLRPV